MGRHRTSPRIVREADHEPGIPRHDLLRAPHHDDGPGGGILHVRHHRGVHVARWRARLHVLRHLQDRRRRCHCADPGRSHCRLLQKAPPRRLRFLHKTAVGAAAVGAMTAAPTILKMTENVQASPPPGDVNTPVMAYVKDAAQGTVVVMWGTQEIVTRDPGLVNRLTTYAR